ncbi:MAG: DUF2795 domain-containing protein [Salinirussus sp.]
MQLTAALEKRLAAHSYPTTTTELIDDHGGLELELPNGRERFGDVLGRLPEETVESADDARLAAYSALGEGAIGRKAYSDRDPTAMGERGPEPLSL